MNYKDDNSVEKSHDLLKLSMFVAIIVVLSQIYISTSITEVPISLGLLGIYVAALQLSPKNTVVVILFYILLGILGLPVFAGHNSGIETILGPTGGYILSYPLVGYIVSFVNVHHEKKSTLYLGFIVAIMWCYCLGSLRLAYVLDISFPNALMVGVIPYVIGDVLKIFAAFFISNYLDYITKEN